MICFTKCLKFGAGGLYALELWCPSFDFRPTRPRIVDTTTGIRRYIRMNKTGHCVNVLQFVSLERPASSRPGQGWLTNLCVTLTGNKLGRGGRHAHEHTLISCSMDSRVRPTPSGISTLPSSVINKMFLAMKGLFLKGTLSSANWMA